MDFARFGEVETLYTTSLQAVLDAPRLRFLTGDSDTEPRSLREGEMILLRSDGGAIAF